jgi:hypothetical protein
MSLTHNKFKSSTIHGTFQNLDYDDNSVQASATFQRNVSIGGVLIVNDISCNKFANYVPISSFTSTLSSYTLNSTLTATLSYYVANSTLATTLSNYVLNSSLSSTLSNYLTNSSASSTYQTIANMNSYLTNSSASSTYQTIANMTNYVTNTVFNTRLNNLETTDSSFNTRIANLESTSTVLLTNSYQPIGLTVITTENYIISPPVTITADSSLFSAPYSSVYLVSGGVYNLYLEKLIVNNSGKLNGTVLKIRVDNLSTGYNFIFLRIYNSYNVFLINGSYTNVLTVYNNSCVEIAVYNTGFVLLR